MNVFLMWPRTYRVALPELGFQNLIVIVIGWVQTTGRHASLVVATGPTPLTRLGPQTVVDAVVAFSSSGSAGSA